MPSYSEYKLKDYDILRERLRNTVGTPVYPSWEDAFDKKWKQRADALPPMSFIYVYDYKQLKTILSKGFSLLGYREGGEFDYRKMSNLMHPNQKNILFLQIIYMALEGQKFIRFAKDGNLVRTTLRAYRDSSDNYWLGQQTIEPFQVDQSNNLVRYLAWVHILGRYNGEPIKTRFSFRNNLGQDDLKTLNAEIAKIRVLVFEQLGFTKQQCFLIELMNITSSTSEICETMRIKEPTLRFHRTGILKNGRKIFPQNRFKTAEDVVKYLSAQQII